MAGAAGFPGGETGHWGRCPAGLVAMSGEEAEDPAGEARQAVFAGLLAVYTGSVLYLLRRNTLLDLDRGFPGIRFNFHTRFLRTDDIRSRP